MIHRTPTPSKTPQRVALFLTDRCNLRCVFCYTTHRRGTHMSVGDMSLKTFRRIYDLLPTTPLWYLGANGEPTLHRDYARIAKFLVAKGKKVRTTTNGARLLKVDAPWGAFDEMCVSVNEVDRDLYKERMGMDKLPQVMQGLKHLRSLHTSFACSFVVGRDNVNRIESYGRFAARYKATAVLLPQMAPSGVGKAEWHLGLEELLHEEFLRLQDKLGPQCRIRFPAPPIEYEERCAGGCHVSETYLAVDAEGNVSPCCGGEGPQPGVYGSVLQQGLDVWRSERVGEYRDRVVGIGEWPDECDGCRAQLSGGEPRWCTWGE